MARLYNGFTEEKWEKILSDPYYSIPIKVIVDKAETYLASQPPQLKFTDIHAFVVTGDRSAYEKAYNEYGGRVNAFFMAYMLTKDDKYIDPLVNAIWDICNVETWALPAHVKEIYSLKDRREFLELVSCNHGRKLGEILTVMEDKLPELVVRRIKNEVRERVIYPYLNKDFSWKRSESNWGAVCICGTLGAFLYVATPEEIEEAIPQMCSTADLFLKGFDDEGCCKEGYAYWHYGFSHFCMFADMLRNYTEGRIDYFADPKVHAIAKFQENVSINETQCVRFSDCGGAFRPDPVLSQFLKTVYPDVQIPSLAPPTYVLSLTDFLWLNSALKDSKLEPKSMTYHENQWFIHRGPVYNFACKAGCNAEPHNHNDVGSFMISKDGEVTFTDPGTGVYTRQYFSSERYSCLEPSSRSHSVPVINGEYQVTGNKRSTVYIDAEHEYAFSMENAYAVESLSSLKRHFVCEDGALILTDTYEFTEEPASVAERFVTLREPVIGEGSITVGATVLTYDPEIFELSVSTEGCVRSATLTETLYMLDLVVKAPSRSFSVSVKFS